MNSARRAVIDVGTNSVKLLVADVARGEVRPVLETSEQTRLGQGFYNTYTLQLAAIKLTASAVARLLSLAQAEGAISVRAIATSAARDAINGAELVAAIRQASGLEAQVISGEQEADWAFRGVATDPELARAAMLLLDVGGGSSEFILGREQRTHFRQSFPLGTLRLMNQLPPGDPPAVAELAACREWVRNFLQEKVQPGLEPARRTELQKTTGVALRLVATGGTASILGCMESQLDTFDRERLEQTRLSRERLRWHVERLWGMPLEQRKKIVGLPANRADVILAGAVIYEQIMEELGFEQMQVTTRGLRFAAVMDPD